MKGGVTLRKLLLMVIFCILIINFAGFNFIREATAAGVKVYGYVMDEAYSPIWGAKVDFRPTTIFAYGDSCTTDSSGYFEVHLMADTTYSVTVSAPPYYETYYGSYTTSNKDDYIVFTLHLIGDGEDRENEEEDSDHDIDDSGDKETDDINYNDNYGDGLVAYWSFDEGYGNIAHDYSGNGNDGIIYGATWVDGIEGKALYFDGEDDYVEILPENIGYLPSVTISAWIKTYGSDTIQQIIERYPDTIPFELTKDLKVWWRGAYCTISNITITTNKWYFIVVTYDYYTKKASIFIDGEIDAYSYCESMGEGNGELNIGRDPDINFQYFHGIIDEVRIYNRAVSESEIKTLYNEVISLQPILHITKTVSKSVLKENETVTVTLKIENTGGENAYNVKISDAIPAGFELIAGQNYAEYDTVETGEYKIVQYILKAIGNGKFILDPATVEYNDAKGNIYSNSSNTVKISVVTESISGSALGNNFLLLIIAIAAIAIVAIIGIIAIIIIRKK